MTYEFFKQEVRKLGLHFWILPTAVAIRNKKLEVVAYIGTKKIFNKSLTSEFCNLDENLQKKLFDLVYLLARTPLDKRGNLCKEDKWYLKHKYLNKWGNNYLHKDLFGGLFLNRKNYDPLVKCKFTKYEIEELKRKINLNDYEKEEVE